MADLGILQVQVVPDMGNFQSQVSGAMSSMAKGVGRVAGQVGRDLASIGSSMVVAGGIGLAAAATVGIKMAANLEKAELQFQTLLGSADAAKGKVAELFEFAKKTPFESGPVIEASRRLEVFGGAALNSTENLERIGNAASATSSGIEEVAFWVGRAYSQIQGGQPFGEAAMRLQELGILTPEVRSEMEKLQEAGASSEEVFGLLQGRLDEFAGAMELQANTLEGLTSTIKDQFSIGMADAFKPFFETLKNALKVVRDFGDSDAFDAIIDNVANFAQIVADILQPALDVIGDQLQGLTRSEVDAFFRDVARFALDFADGAGQVYDTIKPLVPLLGGMGAAFLSMKASAIPLVGLLFPQVTGLTGALLGLTLGVEGNRDALKDFGDAAAHAGQNALPQMRDAIDTISTSINTAFVGALDALQPAMEVVVEDLLPALVNALSEVFPPLADVIVELAKLGSGVLVNVGPALVAVAQGVAGILSAGLRLLADTFGFLNDHLAITGPLLAGVALAFGAIQLVSFISSLKIVASLLKAIKSAMAVEGGLALFARATAAAETLGLTIGALSAGISVGLFAAVAGLGALFAYTMKRNADRAKDAEARVKALAREIEHVGTTTKVATDYVDRFNDSSSRYAGLVDDFERAGISQEELTQAIRGGADAQEELLAKLREMPTVDPTTGVNTGVAQLEAGFKSMVGEWEKAEALGPGMFDKISGAVGGAADRQQEAADKTQAHTDALGRLRDALDEAANSAQGVLRADTERQEGLAKMAGALAEVHANQALVNGEFDLSQEAGREGSRILDEQVTNTRAYIDAVIAAGGSTEELTTKSMGAYDALVNQTAVGMGITTEAAAALLTKYGLFPEDITSKVNLEDEAAKVEAEKLTNQLNSLPGVPEPVKSWINAKIQAGDLEGAATDIDNFILEQERKKIDIGVNVLKATFSGGVFNFGQTAQSGVQGVPMYGPDASAGVGVRATSVALAPRVYGPRLFDGLAARGAVVVPQVENKVFLGTTQITDLVRQEARIIERDRSMAYITAT